MIPALCAKWHADKHVVKMLLEAMQILYTAHWLTQPNAGEWIKRAPLNKSGNHGYKKISTPGHPSVLWVMESKANYQWLVDLGTHLNIEYRSRYGDKEHSAEAHLFWLQKNYLPSYTTSTDGLTPPKLAMTPECKEYAAEHSLEADEAYRHYYVQVKLPVLSYRNLIIPPFLQEHLSEEENHRRLGLLTPVSVNLVRSALLHEKMTRETKLAYGVDSEEKKNLLLQAVATQKETPRKWTEYAENGRKITNAVRRMLRDLPSVSQTNFNIKRKFTAEDESSPPEDRKKVKKP